MRVGSHNSNRRDSKRANVGAVQIGWWRGNATSGVVRVALACRGRLLCRRPAPSRGDGATGVEDRGRAGLPEPTLRCLRAPCRPHERGRMPALLTAVEVGSGSATPDELEVHVRAVSGHVPKKPAVAIGPVEPGIGLEHDPLSDRREAEQRGPRGPRITLAGAKLGRVDLEEAHPATVAEGERVAVVHGRDDRNLGSQRASPSQLRRRRKSSAGRGPRTWPTAGRSAETHAHSFSFAAASRS